VHRVFLEHREFQADLLHHVHLSAHVNQVLPEIKNTNKILGQLICYVHI
jgi:hypothetical protein